MTRPFEVKAPGQVTVAVVPSVVDADALGLAVRIGAPAGVAVPPASFQVASEFGALLRALTVNAAALPFGMDGLATIRLYSVPTASPAETDTVTLCPATVTT